MGTDAWLIVATVIAVGMVVIWFVSRSGGGAIKLRVQELETELASFREKNAGLEKSLAIEQLKSAIVPKLEASVVDLKAQLEGVRETKSTIECELATTSEALRAQGAANSELRAKLETTIDQVQHARQDLDAERLASSNLRTELATSQQALQTERNQSEERMALLSNAQERLTQQFKLIADEIMKRHGADFSKQHREQLSGILDPMRQKILEFEQGLQGAQTESAKERAALQQQIRSLSEASARMSSETENLTRALKGKVQTQGAWGEMILGTILERSGLRKNHEYIAQEQTTTDEGERLRPDVIVNLPNSQSIVIDAKVSLKAFERMIGAETDEARALALSQHVTSVRNHMKLLGDKEYHRASSDLDYVIMFIPIEGALAAALESDPALTVLATENNVAIATPTTLMIALRTVASLWHVERRNRNADDIAQRAGKLYDKFIGFVSDLQNIGEHLESSRRCLDGAMNKLSMGQGNLVRQVELMKELGARTQKSLPIELVDQSSMEPIPSSTGAHGAPLATIVEPTQSQTN